MDRFGNTEPVPGNEPIGVDPVGKLRVGAARDRDGNPSSQTICDKDRMYLASIDNDDYFRYVLDVANRNNASFYPIDPRGLAAFDAPIGPDAPPTIEVDRAMLNKRIDTLRTLAENTDGVAVVNTNNLNRGMQRIADDLSSYYLLGYYSTNTKLDGQFRRITVRVRRPGVEVRARRGYRAATAEEVNASRAAAAAPIPEATKTATAALARLGGIRPEQRFVIHASPFRASPSAPVSAVWVAGELQGPAGGVRDRRQRIDRNQRRCRRRRIHRHAEAGRTRVPREDSSAGRNHRRVRHSSQDDARRGWNAGHGRRETRSRSGAAAAAAVQEGTVDRQPLAAGRRLPVQSNRSIAPRAADFDRHSRHGPFTGRQRATAPDSGAGRRKDGWGRAALADGGCDALGARRRATTCSRSPSTPRAPSGGC